MPIHPLLFIMLISLANSNNCSKIFMILPVKISVVIILVLLINPSVQARSINAMTFSDLALAQCVKTLAEQNHWQSNDQITKLKCHGKGIKKVDDIVNFPQLSYLSLFNNNIVEADLSSLTQLKYVNLANNKLADIKLNNLSHLETLYLFKNKLTTIDFSGLTALKKVRATNNRLNKLDISPLKSLEKAYFFDNKLKDLIVKGMPKLKFIELRQNPMTDEVYDRYDELDGITIVHDGNADDWK